MVPTNEEFRELYVRKFREAQVRRFEESLKEFTDTIRKDFYERLDGTSKTSP